MSQRISLKETERQVFRSTFQDGLLEVMIGTILSMLAITPLLSDRLGDFWSSMLFAPVWLIVYGIIWALRRYVITPRMGTVRFGLTRKRRLIRFNLLMVIVNIVALILGLLAASHPAFRGLVPPVTLALILLVAGSLAAYYLDYPPLLLYAVLTGLAPLVGEYLWRNHGFSHHGFPVTFGLASATMIIIGLYKFVTLLRRYPLPDADEPQEA